MTTAAAIFTCAMWALLGYLLGVDSGMKKERANITKWLRGVNHYVAKSLADRIERKEHLK